MSDYPLRSLRIRGHVTHSGRSGPIENAHVRLTDTAAQLVDETRTDETGCFELRAPRIDGDGHYLVICEAFGVEDRVQVQEARVDVSLDLPLDMRISTFTYAGEDRLVPAAQAPVGQRTVLRVETAAEGHHIHDYDWHERLGARLTRREGGKEAELVFSRPGTTTITATLNERRDTPFRARARSTIEFLVAEPEVRTVGGHMRVTLERTDSVRTLDEALWAAIHECTEAIGFEHYHNYIRRVFELDDRVPIPNEFSRRLTELGARGVGSYRTLRDLTELFLVSRCGPAAFGDRFDDNPLVAFADPERRLAREERAREEIDERLRAYLHNGELPYIERVVNAAYPWLNQEGQGIRPSHPPDVPPAADDRTLARDVP